MASIVTSVIRSIGSGYILSGFTRYINPELLSSLMFLGVILASDNLSSEFIESFSNCIIIEFIMIHSSAGIAAISMMATSQKTKRNLLLLIGGFYFLFVIALALGFGAWWTAVVFVLIIYSRIRVPYDKNQTPSLIIEIMVTFARFAIYMLTAVLAAVLIGGDDTFIMLLWGCIYYLTLFLLRNQINRLRSSTFFTSKRFDKSDKKDFQA
ncbi:MAG TPA: hypothetical protein PKL31_09390 [Fulvivirga sp.]|nr:hypothetical protein [Fulvivirga sp.]